MAKNITEYNRRCLEQGSYMLYNLADYAESDGGVTLYKPTLFNHDALVANKELVKTIISQVPFYIHETLDDVPTTDEDIEDFLFLPDSRDSGINDVHSKLQENEFWSTWLRDAWGDEANRLLLDIYNKMRWSFMSENTYMNAISLLKDDDTSTLEFESDEESDEYMKEIVESKLQNIYSLLNYNMNSSEYLNDWAESLVNSGKLTRQEADREILVYKLQDVRNEVIRRKFAGSSILYRMLLNSIDRQGTFCGATRVGRVTGRESYSDPRLMRSVYAPWLIPFDEVTSVNYGENLRELWHEEGGIPLGLFEPLFYTDDGNLRRDQGNNEFSVDEPQGSLEVSKVRKSYTLLRLDQVLVPASNNRHGIVYLNPQEFLTREAWDSNELYATDGGFSYTLKELLIESYGLSTNITYEDACGAILHAIGEGQYNLGSSTEIIYSDATLDAYTTATIGDGYKVANMLDITANKVLYHDNTIFKEMGGEYPYPTVNGHPICLMDTTWIEHLKRLGEDKTRVSESVLYGVQVGEVLDVSDMDYYSFYWVNGSGNLVEERYNSDSDVFLKSITYGDTRTESTSQSSNSPYRGKDYNGRCNVYKPVVTTSSMTDAERIEAMEENEAKRVAFSEIKHKLALNNITPHRSKVRKVTDNYFTGSSKTFTEPVAQWAEVDDLHGKTVVWNQLIETPVKAINGVWSYVAIGNLTTVSGHKYLYIVNPIKKSGKVRTVSDGDAPYIDATTFSKGVEIIISGTGVNTIFFIHSDGNSADEEVHASIVDLTMLFGVTETSQVTEAMKSWVRAYAESHPQYNSGEVKDSENIVVESRGKNLFDNSNLKTGCFSGGNGNYFSTDAWLCDEAYIPYSKSTINVYTDAYSRLAFYRADKSFISTKDVTKLEHSVTVPIGTAYVRYTINTTDRNVAMCIGEMDAYEPYKHSTLSIPVSLKKGDVYEPSTGELSETYGKVASGLEWVFQNEDVYYAVVADIKQEASMEIMCNRYETTTILYSSSSRPDKTISSRNNYNRVYIKDSAFVGHDVAWVNTYLSDVELIYPLATPIAPHKVAEPIDNGIQVWKDGTITVESSGAQATAKIHYLS